MLQMSSAIHNILYVLCILEFSTDIDGSIQSIPFPEKFSQCVQRRTRGLKPSDVPGHSINSYCLKTFKLREYDIKTLKLDIPNETLNWVHSLLRQLHPHRHKRQTFQRRIRKEIRLLTDTERREFLQAMVDLKADTSIFPNKYDALGRIHSGTFVIDSVHDSSNFFGWHRLYLLVVEQALREKNPHVTLPYWDQTMDFDMEDPTTSVIWTSKFMGNGDGLVTSGPFANWITSDNVPLVRNIGSTGTLISKTAVEMILSRLYHVQINEGSADIRYSLEGHHDSVHRWIDGQMAGLDSSPHEPAFWIHHTFVDYIWHQFRLKQKLNGINPANDYPPTNMTLHEPYRRMAAFSPLLNIDGFSNFWDGIVLYEDPPTCSRSTKCGSPYINCIQNKCVSVDSSFVGEVSGFPKGTNASNSHTVMSLSRKKALALGPLPIGKRFSYYFVDTRTRDDPMPVRPRINNDNNTQPIPFGKVFYWALNRWRSITRMKKNKKNLRHTIHNKGNRFMSKGFNKMSINLRPPSMGTQFQLGGKVTNNRANIHPSFQNTFLMNGLADIRQWVFIPVRILYKKPYNSQFTRVMTQNHVSNTGNLYSPYHTNVHSRLPTGYAKCYENDFGKQKVFVHSEGIDYLGTYTDYAFVDARKTISSSVTYIAVKNPDNGMSKAIISAYDSCGRMCTPTCLVYGSYPAMFKRCSGTIKLTGKSPKMFGIPNMNMVNASQRPNGYEIPIHMNNQIFLSFKCFYENSWPWKNCN